jgi:transcription termination factor 2
MFLLDVHWNPALELQASDRIYRMGQSKNVKIYKFLCSNTIETSIQELQAKKRQLSENFVNAKASNIPGMAPIISNRLTVNDLKTLFQIK